MIRSLCSRAEQVYVNLELSSDRYHSMVTLSHYLPFDDWQIGVPDNGRRGRQCPA